ncbi:hypothetical protein T484DRAFT_1761716, partial [Baffinella frigidus]
MAQHASSEFVQEWGCGSLMNLARHSDNKSAMERKGGIEAVVQAMGLHRASAGVQEQGCGALMNFVLNSLGNKVAFAAKAVAVAAKGGIEAVVEAMGGHVSSVGVQEWG